MFATIRRNICRKATMFLVATTASTALVAQPVPIFDAHMHYNIEARDPYPPAKVLEIFRKNNVRGILGNSRPNEGTELLMKAAPASLTVVPFIRVYRDRADYGTWHRNPEIVAMIEREFTQGNMAGKVRG
ncbi:MAG TPA: amidohydrolase, partial [Casimicrobium huifangae]|nr:amidohydrolase [Casimicrobium huifangae]